MRIIIEEKVVKEIKSFKNKKLLAVVRYVLAVFEEEGLALMGSALVKHLENRIYYLRIDKFRVCYRLYFIVVDDTAYIFASLIKKTNIIPKVDLNRIRKKAQLLQNQCKHHEGKE